MNLSVFNKIPTRFLRLAAPVLILVVAGLGQFWWAWVPISFSLSLIFLITLVGLVWSAKHQAQKSAVATLLAAVLSPLLLNISPSDLGTPLFLLGLVLSLPILAWWRHWPLYNLVALAGISFVYLMWFESYTPGQISPDLFSSFLLSAFYFVSYLATSLIYRFWRQEPSQRQDRVFIFSAIGLFALQTYNYFFDTFTPYFSYLSLGLALAYLGLWYLVKKIGPRDQKLQNSFGLIAIILATLSIPLAFSSRVSLWLWILEASIIFVLSYQTKRYRRHVH